MGIKDTEGATIFIIHALAPRFPTLAAVTRAMARFFIKGPRYAENLFLECKIAHQKL